MLTEIFEIINMRGHMDIVHELIYFQNNRNHKQFASKFM